MYVCMYVCACIYDVFVHMDIVKEDCMRAVERVRPCMYVCMYVCVCMYI
jgi:hypothetical protein